MPEIRNEFHHIIPRLILRGFLADPQPDYQEVRRARSFENGGRREEKKKKKKRSKRKRSVMSPPREGEGEAKGDDGGSSVDEEGGPAGSDQTGLELEISKEKVGEGIGALDLKRDIQEELEAARPKSGPEEGVEARTPLGDSEEDRSPSPKPIIKEAKGKTRKFNADFYNRNRFIKVYDLKTGTLGFHRIGDVYGGFGLYLDLHHEPADHIERQLAILEGEASTIINMVKRCQTDGTCEFSLTQKEWGILLKFLFLMRYRGSEFRAKYTPKIEDYTHSDREMLAQFMAEKRIAEPFQVWLLNIGAILKTDIDQDGEWVRTISAEVYGIDAASYISHMQESCIAFCEPSSPADEFIITDNAFDTAEGPAAYGLANLPEEGSDKHILKLQHTQYHKLAPLARRLMLVLRHNPTALTAPPGMPGWPGGESLLNDLPVESPLANADTEGGPPTLRISKISSEQTHLINAVLLHGVTESISFVSDTALERTLRAFLDNPSFMLDRRLEVFPEFGMWLSQRCQKERLLSLLDRPYHAGRVDPPEGLQSAVQSLRSCEELQNYFMLGGTPEMFHHDSHQALMVTEMRNYAAQGKPAPSQSLISGRSALDLMATLSSRIIWIHLKFWKVGAERVRKGFQDDPEGVVGAEVPLEAGPEDLVAKLAEYLPQGNLSGLMLEASSKHHRRVHNEEVMDGQRMPEPSRVNARLEEDREMFEQWGGLKNSFFSEETPLHHKSMSPLPKERYQELYEEDLSARRELRGRLEDNVLNGRGEPESYEWLGQLLWHHLYPLPPDSMFSEEQHGSHAKLPC